MAADGGTGQPQRVEKSQMELDGGTTAGMSGSSSHKMLALTGVTGETHEDAHGDATTVDDDTLAAGLAHEDPGAEATVRENAVPFVTVDRRKSKKKQRHSELTETANMGKVQRTNKNVKPTQAHRTGVSKRGGKTAAGQAGKDLSAAAKATVIDKCLYQLRGFIEQRSADITIIEQVKRIQQLETAAGQSLLSRTITIDGDVEGERATLRQQIAQWLLRDHVSIQELRQRLRQVLLHYKPTTSAPPQMDWRAALTGAPQPEAEASGDDDCDMQGDEPPQRSGLGGGVGRALPAGAAPPPVPPLVRPRQLRELTQQEQDDLSARCAGAYETKSPPSYLRAALPIAEYAAVLDGYEATVRGRMLAVLLPNMKVEDDVSHFAILRHMRVGDELQSLRGAAADFRDIVMEATHQPEARTLHFKVIGRPSAAAWHDRQIPYQGRLLTLVDVSDGAAVKTTYTVTLHNPTGTVAAAEVIDVLQRQLRLTVLDFDQGYSTSDEHSETEPGQWRVTLQAPGCPDQLRDVTVLMLGQRRVWVHHTEAHASHPCRYCYDPTHIDKACPSRETTRAQHCLRVVSGASCKAAGALVKDPTEHVTAWLQRVRLATQLEHEGDDEQHLGERMRDVTRLPNGKGPLVSLRQAQLLANGWLQLHGDWERHVQTTEYQNLWSKYRLPAPQWDNGPMDPDDRLERLRTAHRDPAPDKQLTETDAQVLTSVQTPPAIATSAATGASAAAEASQVARRSDATELSQPVVQTTTDVSALPPTIETGADPANDHTMEEPRRQRGSSTGPVVTGTKTRSVGAKPASRRGHTKTPRTAVVERASRTRRTGTSPRRPSSSRKPELLDLTSSPETTMQDNNIAATVTLTNDIADHVMLDATTSANGANLEVRDPRTPRPTAARAALLALRGRPPAYGAGTYSPVDDHPYIKHLLTDLMATICPTPANGNCMSTALLEAAVNRPLRTMTTEEQLVLEHAMRELKHDIFTAFDEDGEREAARMHHGASVQWMEDTGCTREEAHHRYFARLRDSDCQAKASVPVAAWGGIEALRMAAKATKTPIYLILEHSELGTCALFKIMLFREGTEAEHWAELQLPYEAWWAHLSRESTVSGEWPPVLHHLDDHYSAVLIEGPPPTTLQPTLRDFFPTAPGPAASTDEGSGMAAAQETTPEEDSVMHPTGTSGDGRNADKDSITTSQDEARSDYEQSATPHHQLVLRSQLNASSVNRVDEVDAFEAEPELTQLTPSQQVELDAYMTSLTAEDLTAHARHHGGMSMAAARHRLWLAQRQSITGLAASTAALPSRDADAASTYAPSDDPDEPTDSDTSMTAESDARSDDFEPTRALAAVVEGYFGKFAGVSMEKHLAKPTTIKKLIDDVAAWTAFFSTLPLAVEHVRDLPERFVRRWGGGALAEIRLHFLCGIISSAPHGPQRTALQAWLDGATSREDARYSARLLGNTDKHRLLLAVIPSDDRAWTQHLYDESWAWVAGILGVACAISTNSTTTTAPAALDLLTDCLKELAEQAYVQSTLEWAADKRQVGQVVELVLGVTRRRQQRPLAHARGATAKAAATLARRM